jgi:uncharacterized protein
LIGIWSHSLFGRAIEMVHPDPREVDFAEIAETLSMINRFTGCAEKPVSVALHTTICVAAARALKATPTQVAHVLLHDAHEARIGDIATPVAQALAAVADGLNDNLRATQCGSYVVREAIAELKDRHDRAIWRAAGLDEPDAATRALVKRCDVIALMTERRDFLAPRPCPWAPEIEAVPPLRSSWKGKWRAPPTVAAELAGLFQAYLPNAPHHFR